MWLSQPWKTNPDLQAIWARFDQIYLQFCTRDRKPIKFGLFDDDTMEYTSLIYHINTTVIHVFMVRRKRGHSFGPFSFRMLFNRLDHGHWTRVSAWQ